MNNVRKEFFFYFFFVNMSLDWQSIKKICIIDVYNTVLFPMNGKTTVFLTFCQI